jgi:hypothetical protein
MAEGAFVAVIFPLYGFALRSLYKVDPPRSFSSRVADAE